VRGVRAHAAAARRSCVEGVASTSRETAHMPLALRAEGHSLVTVVDHVSYALVKSDA